MIHTNEPELDTCDHASGTILARGALMSGGSMHPGTTGRTRPVIDRRNNKAVREIAKLRARRAARLAAESAAGRRRMVVTGVCALATVALGIVIAATSIAWAWIAIPAAALVASLATSRVAAVRSQRASERELELLTKLRGDVRGAGRATAAAPAETQASVAEEAVEAAVEVSEPQTGSVPSLGFNVEVPEVVEVAPGTYRVPARLALDELGELFDLEIDDDDVDTVGGLLTKAIGRVPLPGAAGDIQGVHLQAEEATGRRRQVSTILASRTPAPEEDTDD